MDLTLFTATAANSARHFFDNLTDKPVRKLDEKRIWIAPSEKPAPRETSGQVLDSGYRIEPAQGPDPEENFANQLLLAHTADGSVAGVY